MKDRLIIQHLLTSAWALHEPVLRQLTALIGRHAAGGRLASVDVKSIVAKRDRRASANRRERIALRSGRAYAQAEHVAIIEIGGVLSHHASQIEDVSQPRGTSCDEIRNALQTALDDDSVRAIMLAIDSPGGTVSGVADLGTFIFDAAHQKPIIAQCDEMAASAAYWLAAQCGEIFVPETGQAGAIGVYTVAEDTSRFFAEELLTKVHMIKAGEFKGMGTRGTKITDEQISEIQRDIDDLYEVFVQHVARGLQIGAKAARQLADGRIHTGRAAVDAGLADGVQSFDETLAQMIDEFSDHKPQNRSIRAMDDLDRRVELAERSVGAVEEFNEAVRGEMKRAKVARSEAVRRVAKRDPDLHRAYLARTNPHQAHTILNSVA